MTSKITFINCPQCNEMIEYNLSNTFRPFCSERCRMIDLGQWANETYKIPIE
ncbi:MAG: DNA gyrase inhibitor YacG, partial [Candidatus Methylopumilus sp.]|nr:DNA gyrase inhibitor YacG [Candidatus Methylopumilus sp.]